MDAKHDPRLRNVHVHSMLWWCFSIIAKSRGLHLENVSLIYFKFFEKKAVESQQSLGCTCHDWMILLFFKLQALKNQPRKKVRKLPKMRSQQRKNLQQSKIWVLFPLDMILVSCRYGCHLAACRYFEKKKKTSYHQQIELFYSCLALQLVREKVEKRDLSYQKKDVLCINQTNHGSTFSVF